MYHIYLYSARVLKLIHVRPRLSFYSIHGPKLDLEYPGDTTPSVASSNGGGGVGSSNGGKVGGKGKNPASRARRSKSLTRSAAGGAKPALSRGSSVDQPAKEKTAAAATFGGGGGGGAGSASGAGSTVAVVAAAVVAVAPNRKGAAARKMRTTRGRAGSAAAATVVAGEKKGVAGQEEGIASSGTDRQQTSSTTRWDRNPSLAKRAAGRLERETDRAAAGPRKPSSPLQRPLRPITKYSSEGDISQQRGASKVRLKPYALCVESMYHFVCKGLQRAFGCSTQRHRRTLCCQQGGKYVTRTMNMLRVDVAVKTS